MADTFPIRININGRFYPLTVDRVQEWRYRDAASMVNKAVSDYKKNYPNQDTQDFLSMTAFQLAMRIIELEENADKSPFFSELQQLNKKMDYFLSTDE